MKLSFSDGTLTVVDACAEVMRKNSRGEITAYVDTLPDGVKNDDRLARAVRNRLEELRPKLRRSA